jgi:aminoglycoside/choline kinase family phosphotransferase
MQDASIAPLKADASFRRYFRIDAGDRSLMLMDAPPPREDVRPFVRIARHLLHMGLRAPRIHAVDAESGLVLLEDFGDETYTRLLNEGADPATLYAMAVDTLVHLHTREESATLDAPPYDTRRLLDEAALLVDWYLPAHCGRSLETTARAAYLAAWRQVLDGLPTMAPTLVLRDYHVDNLMRVRDVTGQIECGLLDFQDALIGAPAYDMVSLLEDARRDLPAALATRMLNRYFAALPRLDNDEFRRWYAVLGVQRHCKVAGIFVRLCARDGKHAYLAHIPRVMRLLDAGLAAVDLSPVRAWLEGHLPDRSRPLPNFDPAEVRCMAQGQPCTRP